MASLLNVGFAPDHDTAGEPLVRARLERFFHVKTSVETRFASSIDHMVTPKRTMAEVGVAWLSSEKDEESRYELRRHYPD